MEDCCAVCAEPLVWLAYGDCGHRDICSTCTIRMRFILEDKHCCICKRECLVVVVTKALGEYTKVVADFTTLPSGSTDGKVGDYWFHSDSAAFFDDEEHYNMIRAMCKLKCSICENESSSHISGNDNIKHHQDFRSIQQLKRHLFNTHKVLMCSLCLEGRKVFICEQKLYSRSQLRRHLSHGDSVVDGSEIERGGFMGHPICAFCQRRFYGDNELYMHMSRDHFTCHICQRRNPGHFEYYKNYDDLENHFRQKHFLCENPDCLAKKFVVFATEADLKRHNALEHAESMSRSQRNVALQIPVSFQYRRPGADRHFSQGARGQRPNEHTSGSESNTEMHNLERAINESILTASMETTNRSPERTGPGTDSVSPNNMASSSMNVASNTPPRYLTALSQRTNSQLSESSFPPLAGRSNFVSQSSRRNEQKAGKSMAAIVRGGQQSIRVLNSAVPSHNMIYSQQSSTLYPTISKSSHAESLKNSNGRAAFSDSSSAISRPMLVIHAQESLSNPEEFPVLERQQRPATSPTSSTACDNHFSKGSIVHLEEPRAANNALLKKIKACLRGDNTAFLAFKGVSSQFQNGDLDAEGYYNHILCLGLSHLVTEIARLCPDVKKQKDFLHLHECKQKSIQQSASAVADNMKSMSVSEDCKADIKKGKEIDAAGNEGTSSLSTVDSGRSIRKDFDDTKDPFKDEYRSAQGKSKLLETSTGSSSDRSSNPQKAHHFPDNLNMSSGEKWVCNACTLLNRSDSTHCMVCRNKRPDMIPLNLKKGKNHEKEKRKKKVKKNVLCDSSTNVESIQSANGVWSNGGGQRLVSIASQRQTVTDSNNKPKNGRL